MVAVHDRLPPASRLTQGTLARTEDYMPTSTIPSDNRNAMTDSTPSASAASSSAAAASIRVYNTLSREKESFETVVPGQVGMYLCGPTVYKEAHIGHMVGPVIFDTIKRYLSYSGYQVKWVVNITDVDDKLIAEAERRGISMAAVAEENTADYLQNLAALGVDQIDAFPQATEHMPHILAFIEQLIARGYAYASSGDVYFDVGRDGEYGKLSNRSVESMQGEGGDTADRKRAAGDFALWKSAKPGEPSWDSPWGPGRPGWHIECSAMSKALLGETFDIHGGGLDLLFPHHENELAQSECCHDKPMVRYWMHNGLMKAAADTGKVGGRNDRASAEGGAESNISDQKISRSKGAGGLAQLIRQHGGERLRFFLLRTHYRSTIVFGEAGLAEAGTALEAFHRLMERFERVTGTPFHDLEGAKTRSAGDQQIQAVVAAVEDQNTLADAARQLHDIRAAFLRKMDDDFNTGAAVSDLFELVRWCNQLIDKSRLEEDRSDSPAQRLLRAGVGCLRELSAILGLFQVPTEPSKSGADTELVDALMALIIELRTTARANKDFAMADRIRDGLAAAKITLEDSKAGTRWRREA